MTRRKRRVALLERTRFEAKPEEGGGVLSFEAWGYEEKGRTVVTRYSMAYVNAALYRGDNGRVLGYDNAHGRHHRHCMGMEEPVKFRSYETQVERFQAEWREIAARLRGKR